MHYKSNCHLFARNLYQCPPDSDMSVKHLNVATNRWKYRLQYKNYLGGVSAISKIHFKRVSSPQAFYITHTQ